MLSRSRHSPTRLVLSLVTLLFITAAARSQNFRGGISGSVVDTSGAAIPNAQVQATDNGTAQVYSTLSSSAGEFAFTDLPLGLYTVTASSTGFSTIKIDKVQVSAGSIYTLPIKLSIAAQATTVEVNAAGVSLDTTDMTQTTVLPTKTVQDTPMNGRDFTQMLSVTPGFGGYSLGGGAGVASVNGTRTNQVNWQIEGADNNDLWWNIPAVNQGGVSGIAGIVLPLDAVDQFSFVTASSPETGRNPGGTVNLAIKSGTNQLHGTAYYFNRNEFFAANTPFAPAGTEKNKVRNQNYGFSLGGPIVRDKAFAFVTYEHQNFVIGNQTASTEPSLAYQAEATSLLGYYGVPVNQVSTNMLSALWPANALTGPAKTSNYFNPGTEHGYSYNGLVKLDYNFNDRNHLSFKWYIGQGNQVAPTSSYLSPYYEVAPIHVQNYSLTYNTVFSPKLTNQVFVGVNYFNQAFQDADNSFQPISLGFNTGATAPSLSGSPTIHISPPAVSTGLTGTASGFDEIGPTPDSGRNDITGHLDEVLSYTMGKHQFRFGGEFRQAQVDDFYQAQQRGIFNFNGSQGPWYTANNGATACATLATQNAGAPPPANITNGDGNVLLLADFLAGCISSSNIVQGDPKRQVFVNTWALFGQDAWQLSPKLNINYGARYDYTGPIHSPYADLSTFDPSAPGGLAVAGVDQQNIYRQFHKGISPRVGFAYQPGGTGDLVIRGGFGLYFDTPNMVPFLNLRNTTNGGPVGVQDNPAGILPVYAVATQSNIVQYGVPLFANGADSVNTPGSIINLFSVNHNFRPSYDYSYNLNIQKSIGPSVIAQIGYVGTQGLHLLTVRDINQAAQGSAFVSVPYGSVSCPAAWSGATPTTSGNNLQCSRPYFSQFPNYGVINELDSIAVSNYSSLQASLRTANWHGLVSQLSYTWSHALDEESGLIPYLPQNSYDYSAEYGNGDFDTRNTFTAYALYEVPGSSHGPKLLTHGWQVNSLLSFHGGQPFSVTASTNSSGNGENADRADLAGNPRVGATHKIVNGAVQWFSPAGFNDPLPGNYGTLRRNQFYNPGYEDVDLSVFKNNYITERINVQFRVEMFNLFNHTNLAPVGAPTAADSGGTITSTIGSYNGAPGIGPGEPYNTQFALKVIF